MNFRNNNLIPVFIPQRAADQGSPMALKGRAMPQDPRLEQTGQQSNLLFD
jgi:hypothetical protein